MMEMLEVERKYHTFALLATGRISKRGFTCVINVLFVVESVVTFLRFMILESYWDYFGIK